MLIVERVWQYSVKTGVRSSLAVEVDVLASRFLGLSDRTVGLKIDLLVLSGTPEALYKDMVSPVSFVVLADADIVLLELVGEGPTGKLTSLVGRIPWCIRASSTASR